MKSCLLFLSFFLMTVSQLAAQEKTYYNQTEFGAMIGRVENTWTGVQDDRINFSMITFHGAKISRHHVVGFSMGYDHYQSISIIPIALGWRGFLGKENGAQLVGGLDIGGGSTLLEKDEESEWGKSWYEGGIMASPSIGGYFPGKKGKTALTVTIAYKRQALSYFNGSFDQSPTPRPFMSSQLPPGYNSINETEYLFKSMVIRMGFSF